MAVRSDSPHRIGSLALLFIPVVAAIYAALRLFREDANFLVPGAYDLHVYHQAAKVLLSGGDIYAPVAHLFPYIYPPIAAILAVPLTLLPWSAAPYPWLAAQGLLLVWLCRRLGLSHGHAVAAATVVILLLEPFESLLGLGQVGLILMVLVVFDIIPRRRWIPGGVGIGLATGIKLTPAVFIIHLWLIGRRKDALVAIGTFAATVVLGFLVTPTPAWGYWTRLAGGDSGANPDAFGWIVNLSIMSATQRFLGVDAGATVGLILSAVVVVLSLAAAVVAHRQGQTLLALGTLGVASTLANPIAWTHHLVWVVLLFASILPYFLGRTPGNAELHDGGPLPTWLVWVTLVVTLWLTTNPQLILPGAPNAVQEIHHYDVWHKCFAAMPDILGAVLAISVLCWGLAARRRAPSPAARTDQMEPEAL